MIMNKRITQIGVVVLVIVVALSAVSVVAAQGPGPDSDRQGNQRDRVAGKLVDAVAGAVGLERADVLAQLREGKSLADVCAEHGVDVQSVVDAVVADLTAEIEQAVADGRITEQRGERLTGRLDDLVSRAMTLSRLNPPILDHPLAVRGVRELIETLSEQMDVDRLEIVQQLRDGQTVAKIAAAAGLDPQALVDAVLAHMTERLQAAVDEGKITQEQMDKALEAAAEFLPEALNTPLPNRPTPIRDRAQEAVENTLVGVLAEAAGMEPGEVLRAIFQPRSLAEIAAEQGLDVDALIATAEARITEQVNQAVADGKITQEQADEALDGLHDRLVERFNAPFRLRPQAAGRIG
jgi:transposase-like protein